MCESEGIINSLLPGHKLEWPIFTTAHPVPGHERVKAVMKVQEETGSGTGGNLLFLAYYLLIFG